MTDNHEGGCALPKQIQDSFDSYPHYFDLILMSIHKSRGKIQRSLNFPYTYSSKLQVQARYFLLGAEEYKEGRRDTIVLVISIVSPFISIKSALWYLKIPISNLCLFYQGTF